MRRLLPVLLLLATACSAARTVEPAELRPGAELTGWVRVPPGTYHLPDETGEGALRLAPGTVLDLTGVTLVGAAEGTAPDQFQGTAVRVFEADRVTIHGGSFRGYKVAVWATRADDLTVQYCDFSGNFRQRLGSSPEAEDSEDWLWPHFNEENQWARNYGAGLYVEDSQRAAIYANYARDGQNGIVLDGVREARVARNDCSFLSGWGVALYRSSDNAVFFNRFDFCVRGYSHGVFQRGQDSSGILMFEQCSRNRLLANSATYGGDGLFLYAGDESLKQTGEGGSNDNVVAGNDFSHAVANGIEATFSTGNLFAHNRLWDCNYGVWAGYSSRSWIVRNDFAHSRYAAVAIEHGRHNVIAENRMRGDAVGVWLWWDEDEELAQTMWGGRNDLRSHGNWLRDNEYADVPEPERLVETTPADGPEPAWDMQRFGLPGSPSSPPPAPVGEERSMERILVDEWGPRPVEPEYSRPRPLAEPFRPTRGSDQPARTYAALGAMLDLARYGFLQPTP